MTWESTAPVLGNSIKEFKRASTKWLQNRIQNDYPSKHKAPFGILDFVKSRQYDIEYTASYYYNGKDAKNYLFIAVPFGMMTPKLRTWYEFGGGKQLEEKGL